MLSSAPFDSNRLPYGGQEHQHEVTTKRLLITSRRQAVSVTTKARGARSPGLNRVRGSDSGADGIGKVTEDDLSYYPDIDWEDSQLTTRPNRAVERRRRRREFLAKRHKFMEWSSNQFSMNHAFAAMFGSSGPNAGWHGPTCDDERLYDRGVVHPLIYIFAERAIIRRRDEYARRLIRKVERGEMPPILLNVMLAYATNLSNHRVRGFSSVAATSAAYAQRAEDGLFTAFEEPNEDMVVSLFLLVMLMVVGNNVQKLQSLGSMFSNLVIAKRWHQIDAENYVDDDDGRLGAGAATNPFDTMNVVRVQVDEGTPEPWAATSRPIHGRGGSLSPPDRLELRREFRRRVAWLILYADAKASFLQLLPPIFDLDIVQLRPVDNALVDRVLALSPDEDDFPCIAAPLGEFFAGYEEIGHFVTYLHRVCDLRVYPTQPPPGENRPSPVAPIDVYRGLSEEMTSWYARLPPHLVTRQPEVGQSYPDLRAIGFSNLMAFHAQYHAAVIILNSPRSLGADEMLAGVDPFDDPVCRQYALDSAQYVLDTILPVFQALPARLHISCIYICYFRAGIVLATHANRSTGTECEWASNRAWEIIAALRVYAPINPFVSFACRILSGMLGSAPPPSLGNIQLLEGPEDVDADSQDLAQTLSKL
ncbi:hypothetical protein IWQ60_003231 [Tieghemiomyces parasiticus]|uniref:Transcription factor domain-containing protein n=1 Tax=Tieghemiomyces parasiticus TaxID=78921 RepID=A0A9W8AGI1_9FUNG|nr:hypothetical protein IWQ60_003231 [Tieghemiomyces parasiticus]